MSYGTVPIPFTPKSVTVPQTSRRITAAQGVVIPIDRFGWMSDGVLREIEKGLPLVSESTIGKDFVNPDLMQVQLEKQKTLLFEGFALPNDPNDMPIPFSEEEDVITEEQREYRKLHDKIIRKKIRKEGASPATGIIKKPPAEDVIDNIGIIKIKSARRKKYVPPGTYPFRATKRPKVQKIPKEKETSALVLTEMDKAFRPGIRPFSQLNNDDEFKIDGLFKPEYEEEEEVPQTSRTIVSEISKIGAIDEEEDYGPHESLLIDASKYDLFWTKNRVPFTREEVEMIAGWKEDIANNMKKADSKTSKLLKTREQALKKTFQSKIAFDKEIELTDRAMETAVNLGPCKSIRAKKSSWEISARTARNDPSSIPYRKAVWNKFVQKVQEIGYIQTEAEKRLALEFRKQLIRGKYVSPDIFWNSVSVLEKTDYISIQTNKIIDHIRRSLNVTMNEFIDYLRENGIPSQFYLIAIDEMELQDAKMRGKTYLNKTTGNRTITVHKAPVRSRAPNTIHLI